MKNILLFVVVCGLGGVSIFLGSVLGNGVSKRGLFVGAVVGGVVGVALGVWLAARFRVLEGAAYVPTLLGGGVGFAVAALIAVNNLDGPIIPFASVSLIGLGAVLGKWLGRRRAA